MVLNGLLVCKGLRLVLTQISVSQGFKVGKTRNICVFHIQSLPIRLYNINRTECPLRTRFSAQSSTEGRSTHTTELKPFLELHLKNELDSMSIHSPPRSSASSEPLPSVVSETRALAMETDNLAEECADGAATLHDKIQVLSTLVKDFMELEVAADEDLSQFLGEMQKSCTNMLENIKSMRRWDMMSNHVPRLTELANAPENYTKPCWWWKGLAGNLTRMKQDLRDISRDLGTDIANLHKLSKDFKKYFKVSTPSTSRGIFQ